jgi:hypothetical protein
MSDSAHASLPSLGSHCSQNGISSLFQGQVITCSGGFWRIKGAIKIGTNNKTQSIVSDPCTIIGSSGDFNEIVYVCTQTPSGKRWEIAPKIRATTQIILQNILDKACAPIGLVTILNGNSYTCNYGYGSAHWSQTEFIQIATVLRKSSIESRPCSQTGDITLLNGSLYYCNGASSTKYLWKKVQASAYPYIVQKSVVLRGLNDLASQIQVDKRKSIPSLPHTRDISSCRGKFSSDWRGLHVDLIITNFANCSTLMMASGNIDCNSGNQKITVFWRQQFELGPRSALIYSANNLFSDALIKCRSAYGPYAGLSYNGPVDIFQIGFE